MCNVSNPYSVRGRKHIGTARLCEASVIALRRNNDKKRSLLIREPAYGYTTCQYIRQIGTVLGRWGDNTTYPKGVQWTIIYDRVVIVFPRESHSIDLKPTARL